MTLHVKSFFNCHELAEGIYAAIIKEGTGSVGNAGFVNLGDATLVFDTFMIPEAAVELKKVAEELTGNKVKYVVNSHYHGDHVNGNQVFSEAAIISTGETRSRIVDMAQQRDPKRMQEEAVGYFKQLQENIENTKNEKTRMDYEWELADKQNFVAAVESIIPTYPTIVFDNKLKISGSKRSVELHHMGNGHSPSDSVMYLPEEKILFSGDLVFNHSHAWMGHGNPKEWVSILKRLNEFEIEQLVPGHGPIGGKEQLNKVMSYIEALLDLVIRSLESEMTAEQIFALDIPHQYNEWQGSPVFQWNLRSLYENLKVNKKSRA